MEQRLSQKATLSSRHQRCMSTKQEKYKKMKKLSDKTIENLLVGSAILVGLGMIGLTIYTFMKGC